MSKSKLHIEDKDRAFCSSLPKLKTSYKRSKDDVWNTLSSQIEGTEKQHKTQRTTISLRPTLRRIASIAAVFAGIAGVSAAVVYGVVSKPKEPQKVASQQNLVAVEIKDGVFIFTNASLSETFAEIAKHYDIEIEYKDSLKRQYSGRFKQALDIDQALHIVCRSMQLEYKHINDKYIITKTKSL